MVSSNWQNDYARKYEDYEALKIPEYWIVDYVGIRRNDSDISLRFEVMIFPDSTFSF